MRPIHATARAAVCAKAQRAGLKTSIDCVSEDSDRFAHVVTPILKYTDYCILNELEAGKTTGNVIRRKNGSLDTAALRKAAKAQSTDGRVRCSAESQRPHLHWRYEKPAHGDGVGEEI